MRVLDSGEVAIEDLGSTNGTYVNDERAEGPTPVMPGDIVRFGNTLWHVTAPGATTLVRRSARGHLTRTAPGSVMVEPPMTLMLEIVEGPGAGTQFDVSRPLVIGRDDTADLVIEDSQASRRHARIEPTAHGAIVEDLQSTNGTFVNDNELHGRVEMGPDDELIIGVTVMQVRTPQEVQRQPSAVRAVPAFAAPESRPAFTEPVRAAASAPADRLRRPRARAPARLARQDEGEPRPARDLRARGARGRDLPRRDLAAAAAPLREVQSQPGRRPQRRRRT